MLIGNDFFVFKYSVKCKRNFQILFIFIEMEETVRLLFAQQFMISKTFILEDETLKKKSVTYMNFMFQLILIFRILRS